MVHLRIAVPPDLTDKVFALLCGTPAVINVVRLRDAAHNPDGDLIQCDVARDHASLVIADLKDLQVRASLHRGRADRHLDLGRGV